MSHYYRGGAGGDGGYSFDLFIRVVKELSDRGTWDEGGAKSIRPNA